MGYVIVNKPRGVGDPKVLSQYFDVKITWKTNLYRETLKTYRYNHFLIILTITKSLLHHWDDIKQVRK
jgi:hypothetical protein